MDRDQQFGPEDVFSPMPPSEGLKMLVSIMMTGHDDGNHVDGPFEMAKWDVSRAHFNDEACRWIDTYLLEGHEKVGKLARLCRSMYGTRDAASIWRRHMVRCVERDFHEGRNCMPRFLLQSRWRSQRIVSW